LQVDVGVDVRLTDQIAGSDERTLIITSREVSAITCVIVSLYLITIHSILELDYLMRVY
jgi:hypothetical protein